MTVAAETMNVQEWFSKALPGACDHGEGVITFALYAPGKRCVHLAGNFNGWDFRKDPMADRGFGYWVCAKRLDAGRHEYQFVLDEQTVICDPYAEAIDRQPTAERAPRAVAHVSRPIYQWHHDDWQRPRFRDLVSYEMHVGDFSPEGTFGGAIQRLDYLHDLGINAIEFMPLYETAPNDYWGYEPTFHMAVRQAFGPYEDLLTLVDECHARGIAVILDMVLAHTGREHPFNRMYPYEQSPWYGQGLGEPNQFALPTLDFHKDPTNAFVRDVQSYWLRVFHVDGFRYDYLAGIGSDHQGKGLPLLLHQAREIRPEAYLIGECIPERPDLVNDSGLGGVWHTRSRIAMDVLLRRQDEQPYRADDFGGTVAAFNPATQDYRQSDFMVNYMECHDDKRVIAALRELGMDDLAAFTRSALGMTILATMPGEVMLYHGQEWGEATPKTPRPNKIHWEALDTDSGRGLHEHYRNMIHLRRSRSSLRGPNFAFDSVDNGARTCVYHRWMGEADQVVVAANFSDQPRRLHVPFPAGGKWHEHFTGELLDIDGGLDVEIEPLAARVYLNGVS